MLLFQSGLQLVDSEITIGIRVYLLEKNAQVMDLFLWELRGDVSHDKSLELGY